MEKKKLSHIVQDKIKEVEHKIIPGISWDKQKSWDKIKDILASKNKQLIMWYFATAASISILVAASIDTTLPYFDQLMGKENPSEMVDLIIPDTKPVSEDQQRIYLNPKIIKNKDLPDDDEFFSSTCFKNKIRRLKQKNDEQEVIEESDATSFKPELSFSPQLNSNSLSGIAPGISMDLRHQLKSKGSKKKYVALGANTTFIFHVRDENGRTEIYPATFINTKYGQSNTRNNKNTEWEISAGYLLNPNQIIYKDTTVRFQYTRTVTGKLKVGPELILTNNLRKLYPGITLSFG